MTQPDPSPGPRGRGSSLLKHISRREFEVLELLARGLSYNMVAAHLSISPHTVHRHVSSLLRKMHASNRYEAVEKFRKIARIG